jgi:DNA-binding PadR family transcriptional regulator
MFLQACLLVLLHKGKSYGYSLAQDLKQFGFDPARIDISIIYRALRGLEMQGLVETAWDEYSLGPQRRMYEITPLGEAVLSAWMQNLHQRKLEIEALESVYDEVTNRHP